MSDYRDILKSTLGIEEACRVYVSGPFAGDEVALRFVLSKLGFTLEHKSAEGLPLAIYGSLASNPRGGARRIIVEGDALAALMHWAKQQFPLLQPGEEGAQKRRNVRRMLESEKEGNVRLGASLLESGGLSMELVNNLLLAWYHQVVKSEEDIVQQLEAGLFRWLPPYCHPIVEDRDNFLFRLAAIQLALPQFSPIRFCQLLQEEVVFYQPEWKPSHANFYSENRENRLRAWNALCGNGRLELSQGLAYLLESQSPEEYRGKPVNSLYLNQVWDARPLKRFLSRPSMFFDKVRILQVLNCSSEAISAVASQLGASLRLSGTVGASQSLADFLPILRHSTVENMLLNGQAALQDCQFSLAGAAQYPQAVESLKGLGINGFTRLDLQGIEQLKNLRTLSLRKNNLSELPEGMKQLKQLRMLSLDENELRELPDWIFKLPLENLTLKHNPFSWDEKRRIRRKFKGQAVRFD